MKKKPSHVRTHSVVDLCFFCVFSLGEIFLLALAAILVWMLILTQKRPVYDIPLPVSRYIQKKCIEEGYRLEWSEAQWDLYGHFRFRNLKVYSRKRQGALIFDADVLQGRLGLSFLASSGIPLDFLTLEGGQVYSVLFDPFSPSGNAVLTELSARIQQSSDRIELNPLQFKFADISVSLGGVIYPDGHFSSLVPKVKDQLLGASERHSKRSLRTSDILSMLAMAVKEGRVSVDFEFNRQKGLSLNGRFFASQVTFLGQGAVRDVEFQLRRDDSMEPFLWSLYGKSSNGFYRQNIEFQLFEGQSFLKKGEDGISLKEMNLFVSQPWVYGYALDFISLNRATYHSYSLEGNYSAAGLDSLLAGKVTIHDLRSGNGEISGILNTRLENIVSWMPYDISIPVTSEYIQAYTDNLPFSDWRFPQVDFRLWGRHISVNHTAVDYLRLCGSYEDQRLRLNDLSYHAGSCSGKGDCLFDFKDQSYRLDLHGSLWPKSLNPWFPGWWSRLFEGIRFGSIEPFADAVIEGRWNDPFDTRLSIYVEGNDVRYHDILFHQGALCIFVDKDYVRLKNIEGRRGPYFLRANVDIGRSSAGRGDKHFEVNSFFPPAELGAAFGLRFLNPIWNEVDLDGGVRLSLAGELNHLNEHEYRGIFSGDFDREGSVDVYGFGFDRLKGRFYTDLQSVQFSQLQGSLFGGSAQGGIGYDFGDRLLTLELELRDCPWQDLMDVVKGFKSDSSSQKGMDDDGGVVSDEGKNTFEGTFDLKGDLSLALGENPLKKLKGKGIWELRDPKLAKVHLLGGLSRLLEEIGMGLGAFRLEKARGQYLFNGPVMRLSEIVITGPALTVEANGQINLQTEELKGNAKLFLMETEKGGLMTIFSTLLKPLGHALEVLIYGDLVAPQWRFKLDPRNLLSNSSEKELKPEGDIHVSSEEGTH